MCEGERCRGSRGHCQLLLQRTLTIGAVFLQMPLHLVRGEACSLAHAKIRQTFFCGLGVCSLHCAPFLGARGRCSFWGGSHSWGSFLSVFACLFVWVSSFFSPAPPRFFFPSRSSDPRTTCSSRPPPPSPQLVLMREWGGRAPPSPRSGIGWQRLQQEGSEERYFC